jgi:hypothetical protein
MNMHRSLWLALPFAFLLPLGCNGAAEPGQETEASETAAAVAPAPAAEAAATAATPVAATRGHRHGRARGPARMLFRAARDLDLSDAQRTTIDNLAAQLHGDHTAAHTRRLALRNALADGVRAGDVDPTVLAPLETGTGTGRQARIERETTALDGLWATLEPAQRTALVASVRARQAEHAARWAAHRSQEGETAGGRGQRWLAHLTDLLGLDATQQETVSGILASAHPEPAAMQTWFAQMKSREEALLTAFQSDAFDASKLALSSPTGAHVGGEQRHVQFLAQLVPILEPDQRDTLASSMETEQN